MHKKTIYIGDVVLWLFWILGGLGICVLAEMKEDYRDAMIIVGGKTTKGEGRAMLNKKIRLSERCCVMNICGVSIIGCPDTGVIIGLNSEGEALIRRLRNGVLFVPKDFNDSELALIKALVENGFCTEQLVTFKLKRAYFHVTSRCTLNCEGCYSYEVQRNQKNDLSLQEIKRILDNLSEAGLAIC